MQKQPKHPLERSMKVRKHTQRSMTLPWKRLQRSTCNNVNGPENTRLSEVKTEKDSVWPHWHVESNSPTPSSQTEKTAWRASERTSSQQEVTGGHGQRGGAATPTACWELPAECIRAVLITGESSVTMDGDTLTGLAVVIISKHKRTSSHCAVFLKLMCSMSITPQKVRRKETRSGRGRKAQKTKGLKGQRRSLTKHT